MSIFKTHKAGTACILFYVILYIVWTLKELVLHPALSQVIEDKSILMIFLSDWILKNLCWTLPALLLIRKFDKDLYIPKKELFGKPKDWKTFFLILGGMSAYCILNSVIAHKGFYFNADGLTECLAFITVGITEEFVFRGFLLNATLTDENKKLAIGVNAVLFLCIHFPIWILHENFVNNMLSLGFIMIMLLSIFFSWSMLKFRNIWIPVIIHSLWDVLVTLLN